MSNEQNMEDKDNALHIGSVVKRGGTISLSWGRYGGFYWKKGYTIRLCLGWFALTYFPEDLDDILERALQ